MVRRGVVGALGASYTVFEKNWTCGECHTENYASKPRCLRCRARKPAGGGGVVSGGAAPASRDGGGGGDANVPVHGEWQEVFDLRQTVPSESRPGTGEPSKSGRGGRADALMVSQGRPAYGSSNNQLDDLDEAAAGLSLPASPGSLRESSSSPLLSLPVPISFSTYFCRCT